MTPALAALPFRFDARAHAYTSLDTGEQLPSITQMLETCGLSDPTWYTDASRARGVAVHKLTADFDLGALDVATCTSRYRGWLLGHVQAMTILQPAILQVEQPSVHPLYRFGGRPDRVWNYDGAVCVGEIKSGPPEPSHAIQTALQAILIAPAYRLPPPSIGRFGLYLKESGKFKVEQFNRRADFDEALRVIRRCCGSS